MQDKRIRLLRDEKISKAVISMSLPAIVGMLIMSVYNLVDTMFVAWLGTPATSATQVVMPIMFLIAAIGLSFGIGAGTLVSRLLGRSELDKANSVVSISFFSTIIASIFFIIISLIFIDPLLSFFGASDNVLILAKEYATFIILGSIFSMSNMAMNNMLRSEGSAKIAMIGMIIGAVINIALDPLLIFSFNLGIKGAAIATALSQSVTFIFLLSTYSRKSTLLKIHIKSFKPTISIYYEIMKIGIPTLIRQFLLSISMGLLNSSALLYGGDNLLAAMGLILRIMIIVMYVIMGIGQGFQPVVGYNIGIGNNQRVIEAFKFTLKCSFFVALLSSIFIIVFDTATFSIFKPEEAVMYYAKKGIIYATISLVCIAISNTITVFYQSMGKGKESLLLSISRQGLFLIPAILILPSLFGDFGVLIAQAVADILALILSVIMFLYYMYSGKMKKDIFDQKNIKVN